MKKFFIYLFGLIAFLSLGLGLCLLGHTKVSFVTPVFTSIALAFAFWIPLRRVWAYLLSSSKLWLRMLVHMLIVGSMAFGGLLAVNFYGAGESGHEVEGVIARKYIKERTNYRHVGRRAIRTGTTQNYYVAIMLPDSTMIEENVGISRYNKLRVGQKRTMTERRGALGFEIVDF